MVRCRGAGSGRCCCSRSLPCRPRRWRRSCRPTPTASSSSRSPRAVVLLAPIGALCAAAARARPGVAGGLAAGAAWPSACSGSDALAYREARLAPRDRMEALEDAAPTMPGRRPLAGQRVGGVRASTSCARREREPARLRPSRPRRSAPRAPLRDSSAATSTSTDQELAYVQSSRASSRAARRTPAARRPASSSIYRNDYYELWRRDPGVAVREHLPLQGLDRCDRAGRRARGRAGSRRRAQAGERLVAAARPPVAQLSPLLARAARRAGAPTRRPGTVRPSGPGRCTGTVDGARGGATRVWLRHDGGRAYTVSIDGRASGQVQQVNTPGQWLEVGAADAWRPARIGSRLPREGACARARATATAGEVGPLALSRARSGRRCGARARRRRAAVRAGAGTGSSWCGGRPRGLMRTVTVAIPVLDGGPLLERGAAARARQRVDRRGRAAGGRLGLHRRLARAGRGARAPSVIDVPAGEFSHGGTRNLLMERASGDARGVPHPGRRAGRRRAGWRACSRASSWPTTWRSRSAPTGRGPDASPMVRRELDESSAPSRPTGAPASTAGRAAGPTAAAVGVLHRRQRLRGPARLGARCRSARCPTPRTRCSPATCCAPATPRPTIPPPPWSTPTTTPPPHLLRRSFDEWRALREVHGFGATRRPAAPALAVQREVRDDLAFMRGEGAPRCALAGRRSRRCHHAARGSGRGAGLARRPPARAGAAALSLEGRGRVRSANAEPPASTTCRGAPSSTVQAPRLADVLVTRFVTAAAAARWVSSAGCASGWLERARAARRRVAWYRAKRAAGHGRRSPPTAPPP